MQKVKIINNTMHVFNRRFPPVGMLVTLIYKDGNICTVDTGISKIVLPLSHVEPVETDLIEIPLKFWTSKKVTIRRKRGKKV